ncbi:TetR/AcrR family transcriptional regulator [Acetobacter persici]|uniref:TetR/AcrR family transcriptional regulator n=1 Tax=Acetobacter persici TaxID=1076596 RepID=UPI0020CE5EFD|nr:TetR/AcrR family transcriptional regulator [Acetobacter persici]MCP9320622.1 TetR/AcrR family transcriptional regulator [Acetobacter persici]
MKNKKNPFGHIQEALHTGYLPFPRQAGSKQLRQERVLRVVREILEEGGLGQCSMSEIAARCRFSKSTLYEAFSSKEELIQALFQKTLKGCRLAGKRAQDEEKDFVKNIIDMASFLSDRESLPVLWFAAIHFGRLKDFSLWLDVNLGKLLKDQINNRTGCLFRDDTIVQVTQMRAVCALMGLFVADSLLSSAGGELLPEMPQDDLRKIVEIILAASEALPEKTPPAEYDT